jgi:hypothetical protein
MDRRNGPLTTHIHAARCSSMRVGIVHRVDHDRNRTDIVGGPRNCRALASLGTETGVRRVKVFELQQGDRQRGRVQFASRAEHGRRGGRRTGETNGDAYSFRAEPGNERGDERGRVQFSGPSRAQQERKESITNYSTSVTARAVFSMTRSGDTMATCWGSFLGHEIQLLRELRRCQAR